MVEEFCGKITEEINEAPAVQRKPLAPESFVDRYGLSQAGYITFEEFKEIYKNHVHYADDANYLKPLPDENLLRGLFNALDPDQRHRISRRDFGATIREKAPQSSFLTRLRKKLLRGKERLHNVILEELQDVDRYFGAQGVLPLAAFQTVMVDYDLPMVDSDKRELLGAKLLFHDKDGNEMVSFLELLEDLGPKPTTVGAAELARMAIRIQAAARGMLARRFARELRDGGIADLKEEVKAIGRDGRAGSPSKPEAKAKQTRPTREERARELKKKKERGAKDQRLKRREAQDAEKRLDAVVRNPRDAREKERQRKAKADLEAFVRE